MISQYSKEIIENILNEFKKNENLTKLYLNFLNPIIEHSINKFYPYIIILIFLYILLLILILIILYIVLKNKLINL